MFLTSEILLAASTLTTFGVETHLILATSQSRTKPDPEQQPASRNWHTALEASAYAWLGVSVIGIIEAQLSFVPEQRQIRKRPLPPELPRPQSVVAQRRCRAPGGAVFGVSGRLSTSSVRAVWAGSDHE